MIQKVNQCLRNMPLQKKLYLAFATFVILPVMTFSGFVLISQQRYMADKINTYLADSVTQVTLRVDHMLEEYENALSYIAMNRQILATFENFENMRPTFYQQYDAIHNTLEPTLMVVGQFLPAYRTMGIYTNNTQWRERGDTIQYIDRISGKDWYPDLKQHKGIYWTEDDGNLIGFLRMLRSSVHAPINYTYIKIDPCALFESDSDPLSDASLYLVDDQKLLYQKHTGKTVLPLDEKADGFRKYEGEEYILVRRRLQTTGWSLCVCCPTGGRYAESMNTILSLVGLAIANLVFLMLTGALIARSLGSRIRKLTASISQAAAGDLNQSIETEDRDEIGELTNQFSRMLDSLREHIHINYENKLLIREAELRALQAQINPHFLYNTLSLINWMAIEHDVEDISDIVCSLSNFYRSVLNHGKTIMTVDDELENIRAYLRIQSFMHDDSFITELHVDERMLKQQMIGVIMQPIVENAIEHGLDMRQEKIGSRLSIHGYLENGEMVFTIQDNGPGMTKTQFEEYISHSGKSYGLKNVQDRLRIAYGENYGLSLDQSVTKGTCIIIRIPCSLKKET